MAAQEELSCWRFRAPQSSDSEPEQTEQFQTADEESLPTSQPPTLRSVFTPSYTCITGTGPRPGVTSPFSRRATPVRSPAITRTPSTSTPQQLLPPSIFDPIDLSSLGISLTDETQQAVDEFNMLTANVFDPVTPTEPIEPENPMLPEQVTTNSMVEPQTNTTVTQNQNRKGEKC